MSTKHKSGYSRERARGRPASSDSRTKLVSVYLHPHVFESVCKHAGAVAPGRWIGMLVEWTCRSEAGEAVSVKKAPAKRAAKKGDPVLDDLAKAGMDVRAASRAKKFGSRKPREKCRHGLPSCLQCEFKSPAKRAASKAASEKASVATEHAHELLPGERIDFKAAAAELRGRSKKPRRTRDEMPLPSGLAGAPGESREDKVRRERYGLPPRERCPACKFELPAHDPKGCDFANALAEDALAEKGRRGSKKPAAVDAELQAKADYASAGEVAPLAAPVLPGPPKKCHGCSTVFETPSEFLEHEASGECPGALPACGKCNARHAPEDWCK
jgi:hypothetical protein